MDRAEAIKRLEWLASVGDVIDSFTVGGGADREAFNMAIAALREQESAENAHCNEPLTLEELYQMDGEPAYCAEYDEWGIVSVESLWRGKDRPFLGRYSRGVIFNYDIEMRGLTLYRHKPKEGADRA